MNDKPQLVERMEGESKKDFKKRKRKALIGRYIIKPITEKAIKVIFK